MVLNKLKDLLVNRRPSRSIICERLQVRTRIAGDANPLLLMIEEHVKDVLLEKYSDEFKLNSTDAKEKTPDYEVDAEIEYNECSVVDNRSFLKRMFSRQSGSNRVIKDRLDIMISAKKNDNMLNRIKKDIETIISEVSDINPENISVERCYGSGNMELIKMVITLS